MQLFKEAHNNKNYLFLEEDQMKKVISLLAVAMMVIGLTGCLDPQDDEGQRVSSAVSSIK